MPMFPCRIIFKYINNADGYDTLHNVDSRILAFKIEAVFPAKPLSNSELGAGLKSTLSQI